MDDVTPEGASTLRRAERWFGPGCVVLIIAVVMIAVLLILGTLWLVDEVANWDGAQDPCTQPAPEGEPRC